MEPENTNAFLQLLFQAATTLSEEQSNAAVQARGAPASEAAADACPLLPSPLPALLLAPRLLRSGRPWCASPGDSLAVTLSHVTLPNRHIAVPCR